MFYMLNDGQFLQQRGCKRGTSLRPVPERLEKSKVYCIANQHVSHYHLWRPSFLDTCIRVEFGLVFERGEMATDCIRSCKCPRCLLKLRRSLTGTISAGRP
jgi:hypothetical protein